CANETLVNGVRRTHAKIVDRPCDTGARSPNRDNEVCQGGAVLRELGKASHDRAQGREPLQQPSPTGEAPPERDAVSIFELEIGGADAGNIDQGALKLM